MCSPIAALLAPGLALAQPTSQTGALDPLLLRRDAPVATTNPSPPFDPTDPELRSRHLGLTSMEERARRLGGELTIDSGPSGTTVRVEVPT